MAPHPTQKIADALESYSARAGEPVGAGAVSATIELSPAGEALRLDGIEQANRLAVACRVVHHDAPSASVDLRAWAEGLAGRITYLFEPLCVQERDDEAGRALLRSRDPDHRDGHRAYYQLELACRPGEGRRGASLSRWAFDETTRARHPLPMQLTAETLARLAEDLGMTAHA